MADQPTLDDRPKGRSRFRVTPGYPLAVLVGLAAADELDRTAFSVLLPNIRDHFELTNEGVLGLVSLSGVAVIALAVPLAFWADRVRRLRIVAGGALLWAVFSVMTGLTPWIWLLVVARSGSGLGRAVSEPTHNSLIADYYGPDQRVTAYGWHKAANSIGQVIGPLLAGGLAYAFGWRTPFIVFGIPTILLILAVSRMHEPIRGLHERRLAGGDSAAVEVEEAPPSFAEAWRIILQIRTIRRIWAALPFLAVSSFGLSSLAAIYYDEVYGVDELGRGIIAAATEPIQLIGLAFGVPLLARLIQREAGLALRSLAVVGVVAGVLIGMFALAPNMVVAVILHGFVAATMAIIPPGLQSSLSLVLPPRVRTLGFAISSVWAIPGLAAIVIIGRLSDSWGLRPAILLLLPIFVVGALILASAGGLVTADIAKVRQSALAQAEMLAARQRGDAKLLLVKNLDVSYGSVQVLFGVDFEIEEGDMVALLGTNGAGKSTLLKAISGTVEPTGGAIVFDGRDMTHAPPEEVSGRGAVQAPGGKGVFPRLSVEENLRVAAWHYRRDVAYLEAARAQVYAYFPILSERRDQPAGNLSGGEQQMLTLGMAFLARPKLLMIDELSLGLAPVIVEQLLEIVRAIREQGTAIILVEQSVNLALTMADTAYFMEKGEIRFHGPTRELLDRPDVLRSVFLEGAGRGAQTATPRVVDVRPRPTSPLASPTGPLLQVAGLRKSFGGIAAVQDVSFDLEAGQVLGIIGPNGAGKTTLFDLVSGFLRADDGSVLFDGRDVTRLGPDARARLGMGRSFQDARLFPSLTVQETISVALEGDRLVRDPLAESLLLPDVRDDEDRIAERVDELIDLLGLGAFREKFIAELSTGSRRIVDLACVLAQEPDVVLFDEPSSGIAQREAEALGPVLLRVRDETNAGLIVIEHDMPLITGIADEMLALDLGAVVVRDTPQAVVRHPKVVASYLGSDEAVIHRSGTGAPAPAGEGTR